MSPTVNTDNWSLPDFTDDTCRRNQWDRSPLYSAHNASNEEIEQIRFEYLLEQAGVV